MNVLTTEDMMLFLKEIPGNDARITISDICFDPPHIRWYIEQKLSIVENGFESGVDDFGRNPEEAVEKSYRAVMRAGKIKVGGKLFKRCGSVFVEVRE